jgi:hypothetical protein
MNEINEIRSMTSCGSTQCTVQSTQSNLSPTTYHRYTGGLRSSPSTSSRNASLLE